MSQGKLRSIAGGSASTQHRSLSGLSKATVDFIRVYAGTTSTAERAQTIVCAWGNTPGRNPKSEHRKLRVASLLEHRDLECIGITIDGAPKHPSRIGYNAERWGYRAAVRREASES